MMASVLVSFTIVALSKTSVPVLCMLSQEEAAAVTEEVSLTAVPAKIAKPWSDKPKKLPKVGKIKAAMILNKKITEIAWAISLWLASMTGAVAAIAEPPQIEEPTPIKIEDLAGILINLKIM